MTDRPILFSAPMVRALLEGQKTQTRRVLKPEPYEYIGGWWITDSVSGDCQLDDWVAGRSGSGPRYAVGDRLWVRETWAAGACAESLAPSMLHPAFWIRDNGGLWYAADSAKPETPVTPKGRNRPGIHMPRWASRLTLIVTNVRVERLQEISEADARAEGISETPTDGNGQNHWLDLGDGELITGWDAREVYASLWDHINGPGAWHENPWVVAVSFTVHHNNIDKLGHTS